jgi:ABC-type uncharacterized transport system substrate-binding protein
MRATRSTLATLVIGTLLAAGMTAPAAAAAKIAVVYPTGRSAYASCAESLVRTLEVSDAEPMVRQFTIAGAGADIAGDVDSMSPDVIAVVGTAGAKWARKHAEGARVVSCLTLDPADASWGGTHLRVSAEDRLKLIAEALSSDVTVGVLYSDSSEAFVAELENAAAGLEMPFLKAHVSGRGRLGAELTTLRKGGADVIIGVVDGDVYAGARVVVILKYCHKYRIAFVGISEAFAKAGALMALYSTPEDQGRQAAEIALAAIGKPDVGYAAPSPVRIAVNEKVRKLIRVSIDDEFMKKVDETFE